MNKFDLTGLTWEEVFEIKFACECQLNGYEKFSDEKSIEIRNRLKKIIRLCDKVRNI